jgi:DmsE family decaheme c-type cytochrome
MEILTEAKRRVSMKRIMVLILFSSLFLVFFLLTTSSQGKAEGKAEYAGADACKGCHEEYYKSYASSIHAKKKIPGSPAKQDACESCHGAGAEHASKGGGKGVGGILVFNKKGDAKAKSAKCLVCHEESKHLAFWDMGAHKKNDISCDDCHKVHVVATQKLKTGETELCFSCHQDIKSQFNKQSHHPVKEGLIKCSSCHDVHGGFGKKLIKADAVNELCYECHSEKRGPFMWEHPPVEENCLTCHEVHGSSHGRLLERKVPQICQSCHDIQGGGHPSKAYTSFYTFNKPAQTDADKNAFFGRSCLNCHTNIHGSNRPGGSGQLFWR